MMKDLGQINKLAMDAYMATWREHHVGWCPPPGFTGDKRWSKLLRGWWPEYTTVDIQPRGSHTLQDLKLWCDNKPTNYWVNNAGNRWYFERRDMAALFKLTFGGAQHD